MITYQWNEEKRQRNLELHKLDFADAWRVYEQPGKIRWKSAYPDEERWIDMAEVEGIVLLLVYTLREEAVRCISFRPAHRKERQRFEDERGESS